MLGSRRTTRKTSERSSSFQGLGGVEATLDLTGEHDNPGYQTDADDEASDSDAEAL